MWYHKHVTKEELRHLLRNREVVLAGNLRLKFMGHCGVIQANA